MSGDSEQQLTARAARGDARAFEQIVLMHEARVRSYLARVVGTADADDVAQETFVKAWSGLSRRRDDGHILPWLLSIAWNAGLDHLRRTRRAQSRDFAWHTTGDTESAAPGTAAVELERALAALELNERSALVLTEGHGWSQSEAAQIMGVPLGTLKSIVSRAKSKILAALGGPEHD